jgi:hypothetical protein
LGGECLGPHGAFALGGGFGVGGGQGVLQRFGWSGAHRTIWVIRRPSGR